MFLCLNDFADEDLNDLEFFLHTIEDFISDQEKNDIARLKKEIENTSDCLQAEFWANNYPTHWQGIFAKHLRRSFFTTLMSLAEDHINMICRSVNAPITNVDLKKKLNCSTICAAQVFLKEHGNFPLPSPELWKVVDNLYLLRNDIIHNGGRIDQGEQEERDLRREARLKAIIEALPGLSLWSAGMLKIEKDFCLFTLETIKTLFNELHREQERLCVS